MINSIIDIFQTLSIIALTYLWWRQREELTVARELISAETERKVEHHKQLKRLTDPETLQQDMEKSAAYVDQMLAPERTTMPRTDQQGPPARIHRPKQIGPKQTFPRKGSL